MRRGRPVLPVEMSGRPTGPAIPAPDPLRDPGLEPALISRRMSPIDMLGEDCEKVLFCFSSVRLTHVVHGPGRCSPASRRRISSLGVAVWNFTRDQRNRNITSSANKISRSCLGSSSRPLASSSDALSIPFSRNFHSCLQVLQPPSRCLGSQLIPSTPTAGCS